MITNIIHKIIDKIVIILVSVFFVSLFLMSSDFNKSTKFINIFVIVIPVILLLIKLYKNNWKFNFIIEPFHWHMFLFGLFCCVTSIWAYDTSSSILVGLNILKTFIYISIFFITFQNSDSIVPLLKGAMYGVFIIVVLFIYNEGILGIFSYFINSQRIENDFMNANILGMQCAISILINIYFIFAYNSKIKLLPFSFLSLIILAISASRKGFVLLIIGLSFLFYYYRIRNTKITFYSVTKNVFVPLFISIIFILCLANTKIFNVMLKRMDGLINAFTGVGKVDGSAEIRFAMNKLGYKIFLENPILGIGIDNPKYLVGRKLGQYFYLHNNYTELLASSGIFGFLLFYSLYFYLIIGFYKYKQYKNKEFYFCVILIFSRLLLDYGCVTFSSRETYYYFFIFCLQLKIMKKNITNINYMKVEN